MSDRNLNFLQLPCISTLKQNINFTSIRTGFNPDIVRRLATDLQIWKASEAEKQIVLAFDEMQIKRNLVYHKGEIIFL